MVHTGSIYRASDIATIANITERSVQMRYPALSSYVVGKDGKALLFSPDVLREFGIVRESATEPPIPSDVHHTRKNRTDAGLPRGRNAELVHYAALTARTYFLADADAIATTGRAKGVTKAVNSAVSQIYRELESNSLPVNATVADMDKITERWLYDWITRKDTTNHPNRTPFIGAYWRDDWQAEWMRVWKKHDFAKSRGSVRYDLWKILENDFDCKQGQGFGRFIFIDDRVSKSYVQQSNDLPRKVNMIVAFDLISGTLLHVEPCEEVTSQAYIRTVLNIAFKFGIDKTTWFLENSKTAIADRLRQFIRSLYTAEDMQWFHRKQHRQLFGAQDYIVRNVPSIPMAIGKGLGESFNASLRDIDGILFPRSFMGTERKEAVQLIRSQNVVRKSDIAPSHDEYFTGLIGAAWGELMNREMITRRSWTKTKGITATRANMMQYYMPEEIKRPTEKQLAMLLYFSQEKQPNKMSLRERGTLTFVHDGVAHNLKHAALYDSTLTAFKFSAIELPWCPGQFAVYTRRKDAVNFLCVARDYTATTAEDAITMRIECREMREHDDVIQVSMEERVAVSNVRLQTAMENGKRYLAQDVNVTAMLPATDETATTDAEIVHSQVITDNGSDDDDDDIDNVLDAI
jgi:hypothetical protein